MKISKALKNQISHFINRDESIVSIINYLFTCDYKAWDIVKILVENFGCQEQLVRDVFKVDFDIEFSSFVTVA